MFKDLTVVNNPFAKYEGIYSVKVATERDDFKRALNKLPLEVYKKGLKRSIVAQLVAMHTLHKTLGSDTRLSRVYTLIGLTEGDVAKIGNLDILADGEEHWEMTVDRTKVGAMGNSPHFGSCYSSRGAYNNTPDYILRFGYFVLLRQLDGQGRLKRRFTIYMNRVGQCGGYYPGEDHGHLGVVGGQTLNIGNCKGITAAKALKVAKSILADKCTKLEDKDFDWKKAKGNG